MEAQRLEVRGISVADFADRLEEIKRDRYFAKELQIIKEGEPRLTTDTDVGKLLGVSQVVLWRYRSRDPKMNRRPKLPDLIRMANKIKTSIDWLVYRHHVVRGIDMTKLDEMLRSDPQRVDKLFAVIEGAPQWQGTSTLEKLQKAIETFESLKGADPETESIRRLVSTSSQDSSLRRKRR